MSLIRNVLVASPASPAVRSAALVVLCLALALALSGCGESEKKEAPTAAAQPAAPAPAVGVMSATARDVPVYGEFVGRTDASQTVEIRARVEGFLKERSFEEGSLVKKGDLLFTIESRQYEEALRRSRADLERQAALLAKAQTDLKRFEALYRQKAVSRDEYESRATSERELVAQVERMRAEMDSTIRDLSYTKVYAPLSGRIGKALVKPGSLVGKGENTLLAEISSTDPMYVDFNISEREYLILAREFVAAQKAGKAPDAASLTLILADDSVYPLPGQADMADRAVDQKTGTLPIRAVFPNPDGLLKPGQFAKIRALMDTLVNVACVPQKAVVDVQGAKAVYVLGPGNVAEARAVTLGPRLDDLVVVEKGIAPGETIIVEGVQKVRPGAPVAPSPIPAPAAPAGQTSPTAPAKPAGS